MVDNKKIKEKEAEVREKYHHLACPFTGHWCCIERCAVWSKEQPVGCKIIDLVDVYLVKARAGEDNYG